MLVAEATKKSSTAQLPHHLWSNEPEIAKIRWSLLVYWIRSSILFWLLVLLVALIYLGSGVNPIWHTKSLDVFVTNFDDGLAGIYFVEAFHQTPSGNQTLNWIFRQPSDLPSTLIEEIEHGKAWASVYMNAGTSDRLNQVLRSIANGNPLDISYLPSTAVTIVYDEGRNFNTVNGYTLPPIRTAIGVASAYYSAYMQSEVAQYSTATLANVIAALSLANITYAPISYKNINLHPATPYPSILATSLGYLFLWLIMISLVRVTVTSMSLAY